MSDYSEIIETLRGTAGGSVSSLVEKLGLESEEEAICAAVDDEIFECTECGWWCEIDEEASADHDLDELTCRQCCEGL